MKFSYKKIMTVYFAVMICSLYGRQLKKINCFHKGGILMRLKEKVSREEKFEAVEDYLSGKRSTSQICTALSVNRSSLQDWVRKYKVEGRESLINCNYKSYDALVKMEAVKYYLDGKGSLDEVCSIYKISNNSTLRRWIKRYNDHERFNSQNSQEDRFMIKGRKTTYEERVEIVAFCVSNNDNYQLASEQFQVSYQQIYMWVQKYRKNGYEALSDKRGKRKPTEELSEIEKVAAQLTLVEAENRRLRMENDFLKKLDEVERRRERAEHIKKTNT
jgi:transposase-like protein